jgi:hypothetical protein
MRAAAATFLGEVLEIPDAASLATDLSAIKRDTNASIYTDSIGLIGRPGGISGIRLPAR